MTFDLLISKFNQFIFVRNYTEVTTLARLQQVVHIMLTHFWY